MESTESALNCGEYKKLTSPAVLGLDVSRYMKADPPWALSVPVPELSVEFPRFHILFPPFVQPQSPLSNVQESAVAETYIHD